MDVFKVDQGFVSNLDRSEDRSLVKMIVETGHRLGASVTAEGVETLEQASDIAEPGSDHLQGYRHSTTLIVDPFHAGRILTGTEAAAFISELLGRRMDDDPALLPIATHRQWILRMLGNLQDVFRNQDRPDDARAMLELASLLQ